MAALSLSLPARRTAAPAPVGSFEWLLGLIANGEGGFGGSAVAVTLAPGEAIGVGAGEVEAGRVTVAARPTGAATAVEIAPGLVVPPADGDDAAAFLRDRWQALDHVGVNLSHREVTDAQWRGLVASIAAAAPAYRLDVGSPNDIVMVVSENGGARASVIEFVHDRIADASSVHICAVLTATRAELEVAFPAPIGAYKPGDEAFFRSIALPSALGLPAYLDLAFSDGGMAPWPQIVAAMGQRII